MQANQASISLIAGEGALCDAPIIPVGEPPLDGTVHPSQLSQLSARWNQVKFSTGGNFSFCYQYQAITRPLPVVMTVVGVTDNHSRVFCPMNEVFECSARMGMSGAIDGALAVAATDDCGQSSLIAVSNRNASVLIASSHNQRTYGLGDLLPSTEVGTYSLCFCPDYEAQWTGGPVCTYQSRNFIQPAGSLILTKVVPRDPETGFITSILPGLRIDLEVICGSGGCLGSPRIKIVESNPKNHMSYFSEQAGCRSSLQSISFLSPVNCIAGSSTNCQLVPLRTSPSSFVFKKIQLDTDTVNGVKVEKTLDVCFCDSGCASKENWFYVYSISVSPMSVNITATTVNTLGLIEIKPSGINSTGSFRTSGSLSREMKIIHSENVVSSYECLTMTQLIGGVSGHDCYGPTNCESPSASSKRGVLYEDITFQQSGWISICFCNEQCGLLTNWQVVTRALIAGPSSGNSKWRATQNLEFEIIFSGSGFGLSDRISIGSPTCTTPQSTGPFPYLLNSSSIVSIKDGNVISVGLEGLVMTMAIPHGLNDSDLISVTNVTTFPIEFESVINTYHKIDVIDAYSVRLPVVGDSGKVNAIGTSNARWMRTNMETFRSGLVIQSPGNYSVCWYPSVSSVGFRAGTLEVQSPPIIYDLMGIGAVAPSVPVPVVLQFSPTLSSTKIESVKLVIPENFEMMDFQGNSIDPPTGASLAVCGLVLVEFKSGSDVPYPQSCRLAIERGLWFLHIFFYPGNGIVGGQRYSITINVKSVSSSSGNAEIWMFDQTEQVKEVAMLRPNRAMLPISSLSDLKVAFEIIDPATGELAGSRFHMHAYCEISCNACILDSDCEDGQLCVSPPVPNRCPKTPPSLQFALRVENSMILPGSQVRLLLLPLLDWDLQLTPTVTCSSFTPTKVCGSMGVISSTVESIVAGPLLGDSVGGGNVLTLTLPLEMDGIDKDTVFVFSVSSLRLPSHGFFPTYFWAEIISPDSKTSVFVRSSSQFWKRPVIARASFTELKSNKRPFRADKYNEIYVEFKLGFSAKKNAIITFQMPRNFACMQRTVLSCDEVVDPEGCSFSPSGVLGKRSIESERDEASWIANGNACILTLQSTTSIFSSSKVVVAFQVGNPPVALQQTDPENVWSVTVQEDNLITSATELSNKLPVLGELTNVSVTPSSFGTGTRNNMSIFFETESDCGVSGARIIVEAPKSGFDFGRICQIYPLNSFYLVNGTVSLDGTCESTRTGRAIITTIIPLRKQTMYGFNLEVRNPETVSSSEVWKLSTESSELHSCDSDPVGYSWNLSRYNLDSIKVQVNNTQPGQSSGISVGPIIVKDPVKEGLRITAPKGYRWKYSRSHFRFFSDERAVVLYSVPAAPVAEPFHELVIGTFAESLKPNTSYFLHALVEVAETTPTGSANVFLIELGNGYAGAAVQAPLVRSISNARLRFQSTLVGEKNNSVCVQFETISIIPKFGAIFIGFFGIEIPDCQVLSWDSDYVHMLPGGVSCYVRNETNRLELRTLKSEIPTGLYRFCLKAVNPPSVKPGTDWRIWSVNLDGKVIDHPAIVESPNITSLMNGGVLNISNFRPKMINSVIFWFQTDWSFISSVPTKIELVVPDTVLVSDNCTVSLLAGEGFAAWPVADNSIDCGDLSFNSSLTAGKKYKFEISGIVNPESDPESNFWTVRLNDRYSTRAIQGLHLRKFRGVRIEARDFSVFAKNVSVDLWMTPSSNSSFVLIEAPSTGWVMRGCGLGCTVSNSAPRFINVSTSLVEGLETKISFQVDHPPAVEPVWGWKISNDFDIAKIPGYQIFDKFDSFSIESVSTATANDPVLVKLSANLTRGRYILHIPQGHVLNHPGTKRCISVSIQPPGSDMTCVGRSIEWENSIEEKVIVSITSVNPSFTANINTYVLQELQNNQRVVRFSSLAGPRIIPRIPNVVVSWDTGSPRSIGSVGVVRISIPQIPDVDRILVSGLVRTGLAVSWFDWSHSQGNATHATFPYSIKASELRGVVAPILRGVSEWTMSIFSGDQLVAESKNIPGPEVLGKLEIVHASLSSYLCGSTTSVLSVVLKSSVVVYGKLRITAPTGYSFRSDGPGLPKNIIFVDMNRTMSSDIQISLGVNLPRLMDPDVSPNWRFELVDSNVVFATNDGLFPGFWLTCTVPFTVFPESKSPKSKTVVRVSFRLDSDVLIASKSLFIQLSAPEGFLFPSSSSCLSSVSTEWLSCVGSGNSATIQSTWNRLLSGAKSIDLLVVNPLSTPEINIWNLTIYVDESPDKVTNRGQFSGYPIQAMTARYSGSNRLGQAGAGFVSFSLETKINSHFEALIHAPRGYTVSCAATGRVCSGNEFHLADTPVRVTIGKNESMSSKQFTIEVFVVNPSSKGSNEFFGISILDPLGTVIDANMRIAASFVQQVYIGLPVMDVLESAARKLSKITIYWTVEVPVVVDQVEVEAPPDFIMASKQYVLPSSNLGCRIDTKGNRLTLTLGGSRGLDADRYSVSFMVMNPSRLPSRNVWSFRISKDQTVYYQAFLTGYELIVN